ncbi:NAD P-binding protein [Gloeophyllum trabeum ATCC 11539]|uniref:NAD P-binding protein n=1 Tax=Gloeophyllum trabeum (strain ATCC 11539 / FP-39264 / Madison 617) TaxID=670483 RepID=S7PVX4_GLOTA|nr:NAD P-binding protein [Gloeophyllum trabeum ATCC 11539]EPQ51668.1 NAD P-binding protein [Gloeophyllum trabeum ATCC 11539]
MSTMKHFAIAGVGHIGEFIAEEFLKLKANGRVSTVLVLTRRVPDGDETLTKLSALGATVKTVDYASESSLTSALAGVDAVLSVVGSAGHGAEAALADAAKAAGVKLFVPSEYGSYSKGAKGGFYTHHADMHKKLEDMQLPHTLIYNGQWSDFIFVAYFGWDVPGGRVAIAGEGNTPISYTTRRDVARFVAHALTTPSPEQLYWKSLCIQGDRKTLNEVAQGYMAKSGRHLEITYTPISQQEQILQDNPPFSVPAIIAYLKHSSSWEIGGADLQSKSPEGLSNDLWPEWNPTSAVDALIETYERA